MAVSTWDLGVRAFVRSVSHAKVLVATIVVYFGFFEVLCSSLCLLLSSRFTLPWIWKNRLRCSVHQPFASLPRRSRPTRSKKGGGRAIGLLLPPVELQATGPGRN